MALTISGSAHHFQALVRQDDGNAIPDAFVGCTMAHTVSACSPAVLEPCGSQEPSSRTVAEGLL